MRVRVISDLHISSANDPTYQWLLDWLLISEGEDDHLVLLGDILDHFHGSVSDYYKHYEVLFDLLNRLVEGGTRLYWVEGNHDVSLAPIRNRIKSLHVSDGSVELQFGDTRLYFEHGDLVNQEDRTYLRWRRFLRSALFRTFVRLLPGNAVFRLGERLSKKSRLQSRVVDLERAEGIRRRYREYASAISKKGYQMIVMGHTHLMQDERLENGAYYSNLGFPPRDRTTIEWRPGDSSFTRKNLPVEND